MPKPDKDIEDWWARLPRHTRVDVVDRLKLDNGFEANRSAMSLDARVELAADLTRQKSHRSLEK